MDEELARGEAFLWREADRHGWAVLQQWGSCDGSDVARLSGGAPGSAKVTDSICFFPSEARSLAAALTAWANRVDPPKRCDFVPGEDRMFQAIDPTDVKESVEVNRKPVGPAKLKISGAPVASEPDLQALKARVDALEDIDTGPAAARLAHGRIDEILKRLSEFEAWVKRVRSS